jgi:hypothetical protein
MIFDDEILDVAALWAALGARLNLEKRPCARSATGLKLAE